jgi:hypothetical protein
MVKSLLAILVALLTAGCSGPSRRVSAAEFQRTFDRRSLQTAYWCSYLGESNGVVYMRVVPRFGGKREVLFTDTNGLSPDFLQQLRHVFRLEHAGAPPERLAARGSYVHPGSKITMPASIAGFERDAVLRYDKDGMDVSPAYNLVTNHNVVTASYCVTAMVYVYPAPSLNSIGSPPEVVAGARARLTGSEFEWCKREIQGAHPGARLVEQRDVTRTEAGQPYFGKLAIFEFNDIFAGSRIPVRSRLYLYCYVGGKWAVKYRFTYPKSEDADREIEEFIQKWSWYGEGG